MIISYRESAHRIAIAATAALLLILTFPMRSALSAPVGSPVSVVRTITMTGSNTTGLHYKDGVIWTTSYNNARVERFSASTGALIGSHIAVGSNPGGPIEVNGHLFVPSAGSNTVTDINMATATVTRTITLSGSNISSLNYDGTYIWAVSFNNAIVQKFNPSTGVVVGSSISVGSSPGTAIMANGHLFVAASGSNTVTDIDMSTGSVTRTITLSGSNISALAHDGTTLWASVFNDAKVARINSSTGSILGYTATGSNPTNIISAGGDIWVGSTGSSNVTRINASTGAVIANISQGGSNISSLNYDGAVIWATNFNNNFVSMIDVATGTVSSTKPTTGSHPVVTLIVENNVWVGAAGTNTITQIGGPTPTTTTAAPTTTLTPTTTLSPTTTLPAATTTTTPAPTTSAAPVATTTPSSVAPPTTANNAASSAPVVQSNADPSIAGTSRTTPVSTSPSVLSKPATTPLPAATTTSLPTEPTPATSIPEVAEVESGSAAVLVNGVESAAVVNRVNNQLIVTTSGVELKVWGVSSDGRTTSLDSNGNLRLTEGDLVEMSVSGLKANAEVEVWMFSTPTKLGVVTANSSGKSSGQFKIPSGITNGDHRFAIDTRLPNNEKATVAVGIVFGAAKTTSTAARILIAIPIALAVAAGLIVPTTIRRRRRVQ